MNGSVSTWIKENRRKAGLNQQQLADKLGVSQPQISIWETGASTPARDMIQKLAAILGVEIDEKTYGVGLGEWLHRRREELGWSREQLAREAKISPLTIYFIESGKTESPQEATLRGLERALGKLPNNLTAELQEERTVEDFKFLGPFPVDEWKENVNNGDKVQCIYVFYDHLKRPVRIGETEDLTRRLTEYDKNYWWFRAPTVESFAYVMVSDSDFRRKAEKVMIKLVGEHAIFNTQDKI
jgi:transcriptional regulator with XRE-family HTH domain